MKKAISVLLVLSMVLGALIPSFVFAASAEEYETIEFGSYPQSIVSDESTLSSLKTLESSLEWISYGYYYGNMDFQDPIQDDYMKYADVQLNGNMYRAVIFTGYRPYSTETGHSDSGNKQAGNGYLTDTVYWFKFEPVKWTVVDKDAGLIVSSLVLDSQAFADKSHISSTTWSFVASESLSNNPNDPTVSTISTFLNETFYNTAFTSTEKTAIKTTTVDNSYETGVKVYADTQEKLFLLSYSSTGTKRTDDYSVISPFPALSTDYAICQGLDVVSETKNALCMMLRTPVKSDISKIFVVSSSSEISTSDTLQTWLGIVPAMYVDLNSLSSCEHNYILNSETPATCTTDGIKHFKCTLCGNEYDETVSASGHTEETVKGCSATCIKEGLTDGVICSVCKTVLVEQQKLALTDHDYKVTLTVPATCESDGSTESIVCVNCGYVNKAAEIIPATGHTVKTVKGYPATCDTDGITDSTICTVCSKVLTSSEIIPATGHNVVTDEAVAVSCEKDGKTEGSHCSKCGQVFVAQTVIPTTGHTFVDDDAVAATCTTDGLTLGFHCGVCGEILSAQEKIPATGHKAGTEQVENFKQATCSLAGSYDIVVRCTVCNAVLSSETVSVEKNDHTYSSQTVLPTCTEDGYTLYKCTVCGDTYKDNYTSATGHKGGTADCVTKAVCEICEQSYGDVDSANHKAIVTDNAVPATCTATGLTEGSHCSACGKVITAQTETPKTAHKYVTTVIAPTCTEDGYTLHKCTVCGDTYKDNYTSATGHKGGAADCVTKAVCIVCQQSYGNVDSTNHKAIVTDNAVSATCTATGLTEGSHCSACGKVITAQTETAKTAHKYAATVIAPTCTEDGYTLYKCTVCGDTYKDNYTSATGHKGGAADCVTKAVCIVCQQSYGNVDSTNHKSIVTDNAVPATCTATGLTEGSHCSACGKVITAQTETVKTAHSYTDTVIVPSCTQQGYTTHKCTVCGTYYNDSVIPATGHTDTDGNGYCDKCNTYTGVPSSQKTCSHICHKDGFLGFIWKIGNAFNKLFRIKQFCSCGAAHW